ncbi:MAG: hypothetical protein WKF70_14895 [Chitinophagaceae bacterium]
MLFHFAKNIAFTKLVKCDDRQREYNFRKLPGVDNNLFHVDVSDDRGNRIIFKMHKEQNGHWKMVDPALPQWIKNAEAQLHEVIEEGIHASQD